MAMAMGAIPAHAQFDNIFRDGTRGAQQADACEEGSSGDRARGAIGGILGGALGRTARNVGVPTFAPVAEFQDQLSSAIACKLDPQEQEQAANATLEATRGGGEDGTEGPPVGQTAAWTSNTREGVSGTSTVTARERGRGNGQGQGQGNNADCILVTDVIIVEGEETRAEKRMCRPPGSARYSIVA